MLFKCYRSPRFIGEKKAQFDAEDQGVHIRGKRRGHNLPNNWDDVPRNASDYKCWKRYRRFQYL